MGRCKCCRSTGKANNVAKVRWRIFGCTIGKSLFKNISIILTEAEGGGGGGEPPTF